MKLNPLKCAFGVELGIFLGIMVFEQGIEANPEKVEAIIKMPPFVTFMKCKDLQGEWRP